jgi:hypothetical protein
MADDRPPRRNAADERQVKFHDRKQRSRRDREINDLKAVLQMEPGRRVLWRILEHCSVFASVWDPSSRIHHNAGRQDVGHFVMAEIVAADDEAIYRMMREAKARDRADDAELTASLTKSVREPDGHDSND